MELEGMPEIFTETSVIGGAFMGNTYNEANGTAVARQIVSPEFMEKFDAATGGKGAGMLHELTEAYEGGKVAIDERRSVPSSKADYKGYLEIHNRATEIEEVKYNLYDVHGNKTDKFRAVRIEFLFNSLISGKERYIMERKYQLFNR